MGVKKSEEYKGARALLKTAPATPEAKKRRITLYIDKDVYHDFQKICVEKSRSVSEVVEAAMQDIIQAVD